MNIIKPILLSVGIILTVASGYAQVCKEKNLKEVQVEKGQFFFDHSERLQVSKGEGKIITSGGEIYNNGKDWCLKTKHYRTGKEMIQCNGSANLYNNEYEQIGYIHLPSHNESVIIMNKDRELLEITKKSASILEVTPYNITSVTANLNGDLSTDIGLEQITESKRLSVRSSYKQRHVLSCNNNVISFKKRQQNQNSIDETDVNGSEVN